MTTNRLAVNVPIPLGPSVAASRAACTDVTTTAPILANVPSSATAFLQWCNQLSSDAANAMAFGGGPYGVIDGLGLSAGSGALLNVAAGHASLFATDELVNATAVTLTYVGDNFVWLSQGATPGVSASAGLAPPDSHSVFLGTATYNGSSITNIDNSGVMDASGGIGIRYTSDLGMPGDSPSANVLFLTQTLYGLWLWTGTKYVKMPSDSKQAFNFASDADVTLAQANYEAEQLVLTDTHPYLTATRNVIFPAIKTGIIGVYNATAQSLGFKVAGGSTVTVASGKRAILAVDGANVVRFAADI